MLEAYKVTILVMGLSGFTFLIQLLIADVIGLKKGHIPGDSIKPDHKDLHFRANRAILNTNESVAIFILLIAFAMLSQANPEYLNMSSIVYFIGRLGHMICYYLNLKLLRSISFGISLLGLVAIFGIGVVGWL